MEVQQTVIGYVQEDDVEKRVSNQGAKGVETYATMVSKGTGNGEISSSGGFGKDYVVVLADDFVIDRSGPFPSVKFSDRVHDQIDRNMCNTVIVRLLGRSIGYKTLLHRIYTLWKPSGDLQLIDLDNNFFMVRFVENDDYIKVLTEGPWTIFGSYLTVQPWTKDFTTAQKFPTHVIVWMRLPGLPYRYYSKALFQVIASIVGKVVKIDYNTKAVERGKFARLAILVNLNKPLIPCIGIDGMVQKLEYEGLSQICFKCGTYGHSKDGCGNTILVPPAEPPVSKHMEVISPQVDKGSELFGPWGNLVGGVTQA
ncbi:hypothetical protein GQ457_10G024680 [Hibiscus cannabinus]